MYPPYFAPSWLRNLTGNYLTWPGVGHSTGDVITHQVLRPGNLWHWGRPLLPHQHPPKPWNSQDGCCLHREGAQPAANHMPAEQVTAWRSPTQETIEELSTFRADSWEGVWISAGAPETQPNWNIRCSEGFILGGPVVKLKTDKHVWEFERLTQKSQGPWLYHYVQAMDPARERAVIFSVPPQFCTLLIPALRDPCLIKCESWNHINGNKAILLQTSGNINNNNVNKTY